MTETGQALEDIRIIEFGGYAAGPHIGKVLANFGATSVHVESKTRPDGFRLEYPPFKDGKPGVNRGGCFAYFNDSKYGVTLDLKSKAGSDLARKLMDWSDIVIENMRPGVMQRLGLGYEDARKTNPGLIMLSTCNMGQTGPRADTPGFGSQLSSLAGFCGVIGNPDGPPMLLYGPYIDFIASSLGASAVLAALDARKRTGGGTWIDISQYETGLQFMAGALLAFHDNGTIAERQGNRDDIAAPHGAYACRDEQWIAFSCWSDKEFERLAECLGQSALSGDERFSTPELRQRNHRELDELLATFCAGHDCRKLASSLQAASIAAHPVNSVADLFEDPQLAARNLWQTREHAEIGDQIYCMPGFDLSETPGNITHAAPLLGGDNEHVFKEFLGMSEAEFKEFEAQGAFN
jgi:crotonobetainyl-CoA:carnitine CoA-transferase CaiB-like acyl-CoA transferase